jgi:hypothetical protein
MVQRLCQAAGLWKTNPICVWTSAEQKVHEKRGNQKSQLKRVMPISSKGCPHCFCFKEWYVLVWMEKGWGMPELSAGRFRLLFSKLVFLSLREGS